MAPIPQPFKIVVHPDENSPLQLLSNEYDAGTLTATDLWKRDLSSSRILSKFLGRRQNSIIPSGYTNQHTGPTAGTVVGIVLGSVAGFLLLLWLLYTCMNLNNASASSTYTESVVVRDRKKSVGSHRSRRSETVEIRRDRSRTPVRIVRPEPVRTERVVVEESRSVRRDHSPGASDEVVVIEEHSPPRRSKSKRGSIEVRRESGYRTVDPDLYAGGGGPMKNVRGSRRSSGR